MFYTKNLPAWERAVRLGGAFAMGLCAWHFRAGPGGVFFGLVSAVTALTSVFGFCPMCAMAGRRLDAADKMIR